MWKNVFLESCILSALIFAGFYLNATLLKEELYSNGNKAPSYLSHISGIGTPPEPPKHISGQKTEKESHISGSVTSSKTRQ
jgi:hypothetical protein